MGSYNLGVGYIMTLCAYCFRDIGNHTETELYVHLKKLSLKVYEDEIKT